MFSIYRGAPSKGGGFSFRSPFNQSEKKSLLRRTALAYLNRLHERPKTYRFDIISIAYGQSKDYKISHYRNVALF